MGHKTERITSTPFFWTDVYNLNLQFFQRKPHWRRLETRNSRGKKFFFAITTKQTIYDDDLATLSKEIKDILIPFTEIPL